MIKSENGSQQIPSWSGFNSLITDEDLPQQTVGFLPVLPSPVTEHRTVYTALKNFQCILSQLKQDNMAVACDEGVYRIAKEIQLKNPEEFGNTVLCLGPFHMIKVVQASIGQYIDGSGAETIWTKNGVFGVNVVKQVLSGKHYKKSLYGLYILSEAIQRLQLEEFFRVHGCDDYVEELNILKCMKVSVGKKDKEQSKKQLSDFMTKSDSLIADFKSFKEDMATKSETFKFWDTFVCMVALLMDLVRSVKEGNWLLHLHTVKCILPLFSIFNRTNYLRWCSLYLEDMQKLEETAPDVYQYFMSGKFAVKHTAGKFKAVPADQCLEQTINRSQKSNAGVIGTTKRKEFVAQWEIIYHETLDVVNLHREICGVGSRYSESDTNHEFNETLTKQMEEKMTKMLSYIHARENPAKIPSEIRLHNILSQAIMSEEIRQSLLSVFARGNEMYQAFRNERYINKTKAISDTISRSKVKTFKSAYEGKSESDKKKATKKESTEAQRIVDVAKERNYDLEHLLKYDLVETSILFENNFMKKPAKSTLCPELEKKLKAHDYGCPSQWSFEVTTTYVVDVMGQTRRVPTVRYKTFEEYATAYFHQIDTLSEHAAAIHLVFDSYIEGSVKDSERLRRNTTPAVEISMINDETLFPDELHSFWASSGNKEKLQLYLRDTVLSGNSKLSPGSIILSGMGVDEENMIHCTSESGHNISELDKDIEEADLRIIQHILYAIKKGAERIVILSNDTDVLVLVLHYMAKFRKKV